MESTFDLRKFLIENRLTNNAKLISERRLALTSQDSIEIDRLVAGAVERFTGDDISEKGTYRFQPVKYELADGTPGTLTMFIRYFDASFLGNFIKNDPQSQDDNVININSKVFIPAYNSFFSSLWRKMTGASPTDLLRQVITHEFIHAKDPAVNHRPLNEPYDNSKVEVYYRSWTEFPTMTGQFMEEILHQTNTLINQGITQESYNTIRAGLQSILDVYAGKESIFNPEVYRLMSPSNNTYSIFQNIANLITGVGMALTGNLAGANAIPSNMDQLAMAITQIKQYHPEAYNEFLKDLYLTVQEAVDNVNSKLPQDFPPMQVGGRGSFRTSFNRNK